MNNSNRRNSNRIKGVPVDTRTIKKIAKTKYGIPLLIILGIGYVIFQFFNGDGSSENDSYVTSGGEIIPGERYEVEVSRFVDGDTTEFYFNGQEERFRFITIDAPEIDREHNNHDPYAIESLERVEELLNNADVITVEFDSGEFQDDYERYLTYVFADDILLNVQLVEEGLATVRYTNTDNRKYIDEMNEAEETAKRQSLGVWSQ